MVVDLAYVLTVENDKAAGSEPTSVQFVQGQSRLVPGLERELYGMSVGEEKDVVVKAANGYGETNPKAIKTLSREKLRTLDKAKPGQTVRLLHKRSGEVHTATVVETKPDVVVLDFNHPLAGKTLHFRVRVDGVRPATAEELEASKP
jgi:FKBP-type peptidyl-prolyl cis-trans isomerase SlyD